MVMTTIVAAEWIDDFAGSMPASYRDRHSREAIAAHAAIAAGRGSSPANMGRFDSPQGRSVVVVAEDRPGLLSRITAAFVVQGWDIVHAEAYTRSLPLHRIAAEGAAAADRSAAEAPMKTEAVDLFWLRRTEGHSGERALSGSDVDAIRETLIGLLEGRIELPETIAADEPAEIHNTRVRFIEGEDGTLCTLEVETRDRSGLLLVLTRALVAQRVTITRSEVRTFSTRVFDRFTIAEFDGSPISEARRLEIQVGVLSAIETPWSVPAKNRQPRRATAGR
jgi:UTP:GlnB (protein PII) uridylyltransferase